MPARNLLVLALLALLVCLLLGPDIAAACPNCKDGLAEQTGAEGEASASTQYAFSYSVLFMVTVPFLLLGSGVTFVIRAVKNGSIPEL